jgi:hypothetical protein
MEKFAGWHGDRCHRKTAQARLNEANKPNFCIMLAPVLHCMPKIVTLQECQLDLTPGFTRPLWQKGALLRGAKRKKQECRFW